MNRLIYEKCKDPTLNIEQFSTRVITWVSSTSGLHGSEMRYRESSISSASNSSNRWLKVGNQTFRVLLFLSPLFSLSPLSFSFSLPPSLSLSLSLFDTPSGSASAQDIVPVYKLIRINISLLFHIIVRYPKTSFPTFYMLYRSSHRPYLPSWGSVFSRRSGGLSITMGHST